MAIPADINARRYYRIAYQRLDDGTALLEISRPRAAIYLTGYAVECILKALLLMSTPAGERAEALATFRGAVAHNIEWQRARLIQRIGRMPVGENRHVRSAAARPARFSLLGQFQRPLWQRSAGHRQIARPNLPALSVSKGPIDRRLRLPELVTPDLMRLE